MTSESDDTPEDRAPAPAQRAAPPPIPRVAGFGPPPSRPTANGRTPLARPEDYWFHVHGAAGSHVVLRRGKGKNEPSKQTVEEVAAWTAFYSQARTAGKVPVIVTRKKYVRKPRKSPPGLAVCEREKTVMVKPQEPPKGALSDAEGEREG